MKKFPLILLAILFSSCVLFRKATESLDEPYQPPIPTLKKKEVCLVLSSGGVKGLSYIGVLEELEKADLMKEVDFIVGCSMGSLMAAIYADSKNVKRMKRLMAKYNEKNDLIEISVPNLRMGATSLYSVRKFLDKRLKAKNFEDLQIPVYTVATNLKYGNLTIFGSGPIIPALWASMAIPGVIAPPLIHGQHFVDGAVIDPVPIDVARALGAKLVIVVDASTCLPSKDPSNLMDVVTRSFTISANANALLQRRDADVVIHTYFGEEVGLLSGQDNPEPIYEAGRKSARKAIPEIRKKMAALKKRRRK